jgi:ribosomal protein S17
MSVKIEKVPQGTLITREPTWWDRILCRIFGHIKIENNPGYYVKSNMGTMILDNVSPPTLMRAHYYNENFKYSSELVACKRCGVYEKISIIETIPLSKDEQMIKDLIE